MRAIRCLLPYMLSEQPLTQGVFTIWRSRNFPWGIVTFQEACKKGPLILIRVFHNSCTNVSCIVLFAFILSRAIFLRFSIIQHMLVPICYHQKFYHYYPSNHWTHYFLGIEEILLNISIKYPTYYYYRLKLPLHP